MTDPTLEEIEEELRRRLRKSAQMEALLKELRAKFAQNHADTEDFPYWLSEIDRVLGR